MFTDDGFPDPSHHLKTNPFDILPTWHYDKNFKIFSKNYEAFMPSKSVQITIYTDLDGKISKGFVFK